MGWFVIKNKDTGKVLDIAEAGDQGANVIQYTQYNTDNQLWTWADNSLISKHRGYALDLAESNPEPGTNVIAWHYHGGKNQQWKLENNKLRSLVCLENCVSVQGHDEWTIQFVGRRAQSGVGGSSSGYAESQLQKHNDYRAKHSSPAMTLCTNLNRAAQIHANKLASAGKWLSASDHDSNRGDVGENIGISASSATYPDYDDVTDKWYSEEKDYDYQAGCSTSGETIGHFTAVVWKGSTELGIAKATGKVDNWFCTWTVGRYSPQGNVSGQYTTNVQQP